MLIDKDNRSLPLLVSGCLLFLLLSSCQGYSHGGYAHGSGYGGHSGYAVGHVPVAVGYAYPGHGMSGYGHSGYGVGGYGGHHGRKK